MLLRMTGTDTEKPAARPVHPGWRLLALLYDGVIAIALLMAGSALLLLLRRGEPVTPGSAVAFVEFVLLWAVLGAYAVLSWRFGGQTAGTRSWRLRVVDADGRTPGWPALLLRYAIASLSAGLAMAWGFIDSQGRGLHDLAAGTLVVRLLP